MAQRSAEPDVNARHEQLLTEDIIFKLAGREQMWEPAFDPMTQEASSSLAHTVTPSWVALEEGPSAMAQPMQGDSPRNTAPSTQNGQAQQVAEMLTDCTMDITQPTQLQEAPAPISVPGTNDIEQAIDAFAQAVTVPLQHTGATIASTPTPRTHRKTRENASTLRRSRRIANRGALGSTLDRAQTVLMRKLGVISDQESISQEAREAYTCLFDHPLSRSHLIALTALFGWAVPPDEKACSTDFLLA